MSNSVFMSRSMTRRREEVVVGAALFLVSLMVPVVCKGQSAHSNLVPSQTRQPAVEKAPSETASDRGAAKPHSDKTSLSDVERAELLQLIRELQERVAKLEAAKGISSTEQPSAVPSPVVSTSDSRPVPPPPVTVSSPPQTNNQKDEFGSYTPNLGFKIANTEYGDLNLSIYTYVRYLNQLGLNSTYEDAFGNTKSVQRRQDIQLLKLQMKFLGWIINPKLRYFLYAWTSNANQGQGAQVVLAGNLNYTINKHVTVGGGIRSLPGTRSVEGNFPFWPSVDSRTIADEFMRPSYTNGIWATGQITDRLEYQVMLGNNMSTLGVPASRLDNGLNTVSSALIWFPTGDFARGFSGQGWGDFEHHEEFSTRLALHFSRSDENRESQPGSDVFENTQLRLSDGTVIFTPDLFGPGIAISDARWRMTTVDGGFKYRGYSLEGEYFWRWLDNFRGTNTAGLATLFDHGFQVQGSAMIIPKTLQAYVSHSRIFGQFGEPWDFRVGTNWFPFENKVVRWNTEGLYLYKSPVGYTSVPFAIGGKGWVFHSSFELAF